MNLQKQQQQCAAVGTQKPVCHFWSPGGVRRRPQRAMSAAMATAGGSDYRGNGFPPAVAACV